MRSAFLIVFALALAAGAACNKNDTTAPSVVTDTFSGTVALKSSDNHTFSVSQTGEVDVTLTSAGPPSTVVMGVGIGTPEGSGCSLLAGATAAVVAGTGVAVAGEVTAGTLCVSVYDVGNETAPISYTVTVAHP